MWWGTEGETCTSFLIQFTILRTNTVHVIDPLELTLRIATDLHPRIYCSCLASYCIYPMHAFVQQGVERLL